MKIDLNRLLEDCSFIDVLDFLGEEYYRKGNRVCIRCPEHVKRTGKEESKIDNCVISKCTYHCFACGAKGHVLHYLMHKRNMSFTNAAIIIANVNGEKLSKYIVDDVDNENDDGSEREPFPLTTLDIQLLNLQRNVMDEIPENIIYKKDDCYDDKVILPRMHYFSFSQNENSNLETVYETGYTVKNSLIRLYENDKEAFEMMIKEKIKEAQAETVACLDSGIIAKFFKNNYFILKTERELKKNLKQLNELAVRFGISEVEAVD